MHYKMLPEQKLTFWYWYLHLLRFDLFLPELMIQSEIKERVDRLVH